MTREDSTPPTTKPEAKADSPAEWANARPLGHDVYWLPGADGIALVWHWCTGAHRGAHGWAASRTSKHKQVSLEPLHLEPSLLCVDCGWHGFIREGTWRPV